MSSSLSTDRDDPRVKKEEEEDDDDIGIWESVDIVRTRTWKWKGTAMISAVGISRSKCSSLINFQKDIGFLYYK